MSETEPAARWEIAPHNGIVSADPPFTDKLFASRMAVVARETATEYWEFAVVKEHAQLLADYLNALESRLAQAEDKAAQAEDKAALADRIREWFASGEEEDGIDFEAWCRDFDAVT